MDKLHNLESRIGKQRNRISSVSEFMGLRGNMIWLVTSPVEIKDNRIKCFGNSFLNTWIVNDIYDIMGNKMCHETIKNTEYSDLITPIGDSTKNKIKDGIEYRMIISLLDYNIIPNTSTNHAAFLDEKSAINYRMWLRMNYQSDSMLDMLDKKIINGKMINWNDFLLNGLPVNTSV